MKHAQAPSADGIFHAAPVWLKTPGVYHRLTISHFKIKSTTPRRTLIILGNISPDDDVAHIELATPPGFQINHSGKGNLALGMYVSYICSLQGEVYRFTALFEVDGFKFPL